MTKPRPYRLRIFLKEEFAAVAARHETPPGLQPLMDVLARHNAALDGTQLEEVRRFVDLFDNNPDFRGGPVVQALYDVSKAALANPEKCGYFAREFTVTVGRRVMFTGHAADALIADLKTLEGTVLERGKTFKNGTSRNTAAVRKNYLPRHHPST